MPTIDGAESSAHDVQEKTDNGGSLCHFHPTDTILEIKSVITEPCTIWRERVNEREGGNSVGNRGEAFISLVYTSTF